MFISFEGCDKAGKTTQSKLLTQYLKQKNTNVIQTREPGGTPFGEEVRSLLLSNTEIDSTAEVLLFMANRIDHYNKLIKPSLDRNTTVICDRFIDSSIAYQGYGYGISIKKILSIYNTIFEPSPPPYPDITFLLEIPEEEYKSRCRNFSTLSKYENKLEFHRKVSKGFREIAAVSPKRFVIIDATMEVNIIHNIIISKINDFQNAK